MLTCSSISLNLIIVSSMEKQCIKRGIDLGILTINGQSSLCTRTLCYYIYKVHFCETVTKQEEEEEKEEEEEEEVVVVLGDLRAKIMQQG